MTFLPSLFLLSWFPACWASCHFHCAGFSSHSASNMGSFAELVSCCAWVPPRGGLAKVVSARLNPRNSTIDVKGVYNFLSSVSPQQNFGATSVRAPCKFPWSQQKFEVTDGPVLQICYSSLLQSVLFGKQMKIHP